MAEVVLGIDAAWTAGQPSGVALAARTGVGWRLAAVAPSYPAFLASAWAPQLEHDHLPRAGRLLESVRGLTGSLPVLVAIDMPMAKTAISGRRFSDDAVSRAYGGRHCSTHSPSALRPGAISDRLTQEFAEAGYPLATTHPTGPALIEVYPHPALVELGRADRRLPYKVGKVRSYWPGLAPADRRARLLEVWAEVIDLLEGEIAGTAVILPLPLADAPGRELKTFEDMLDAVVCAWVGICVLAGHAVAFGDDGSAIWIPTPRAA